MSKYTQTLLKIREAEERLKEIQRLLVEYKKEPASVPQIKKQELNEADLTKLSVIGGVMKTGKTKIFARPKIVGPPLGEITKIGMFKPFEVIKVEGKDFPYYDIKENAWFKYSPKKSVQFPFYKKQEGYGAEPKIEIYPPSKEWEEELKWRQKHRLKSRLD